MSHRTLLEVIDQIEFSDHACDLFIALSGFEPSDEEAAVVLVAAAQLLARQHPESTSRGGAALSELCDEFGDLVFEARARLVSGRCQPALRVVGGTDVQ